jgi:hypothetical protein
MSFLALSFIVPKFRKMSKASKARKFIFAFLSRVANCLQNERREASPLVFEN